MDVLTCMKRHTNVGGMGLSISWVDQRTIEGLVRCLDIVTSRVDLMQFVFFKLLLRCSNGVRPLLSSLPAQQFLTILFIHCLHL